MRNPLYRSGDACLSRWSAASPLGVQFRRCNGALAGLLLKNTNNRTQHGGEQAAAAAGAALLAPPGESPGLPESGPEVPRAGGSEPARHAPYDARPPAPIEGSHSASVSLRRDLRARGAAPLASAAAAPSSGCSRTAATQWQCAGGSTIARTDASPAPELNGGSVTMRGQSRAVWLSAHADGARPCRFE